MSKNYSKLSERKGLKENLFEKMGDLAIKEGTVEKEDIKNLAQEYLMGDASILGTATFYDFLRPENKGKKVFVCNGSACMLSGKQGEVKKQLSSHFSEDEIGEMCCLGHCYETAAFHYDGNNYSGESAEQISAISKKERVGEAPDYHVGSYGSTILTDTFPGYDAYFSTLKNMLAKNPDDALAEMKESGLRGRGGAGFPAAFKLQGCKNEKSDKKYIVCNADEGDPGAFSDRYILEQRAEALLFGMLIAGYIVGADTGVLYIRGEYPEAIENVRNVINLFEEKGFTGMNICQTKFKFKFKVIKGQGSYICGEETALLSSIEGQRPEVRIRPPFPTQKGLFQQPTIVNNVETLAFMPFIIEKGGKAFANIGTEKSTGTKLVSLNSFFRNPGMYEVEMGTSLSVVINDLGGGFSEPVKALHIGGPLGGLVPLSEVEKLNVDFESFSENGFLMGHASILSIPQSYPIVKYLEHLFAFTAHESCGKCFPCRLGSVRGKELLEGAINGKHKIDRELFDDLLETLEIGSLCALGGGLPLPIKNALQYFQEELKEYFD